MNPIVNPNSYLTPTYTKEVDKEQLKKNPSSGAILTKDSLEVPFEKQIKIQSQEAEAGKPSLSPLFHMRLAEDRSTDELRRYYYQLLRKNLSPFLKEKLNKNEKQALPDRNLELIALEKSLQFEADLLTLMDRSSIPTAQPNTDRFTPQAQWTFISSSLLMALQVAFYGHESEKSQIGFIGPAMQRLQQLLARFMHLILTPEEQHCIPLLSFFNELMAIGTMFITTHLSEIWKDAFSNDDTLEVEQAGNLFKELSLTFFLGSGMIEFAYNAMSENLELNKRNPHFMAYIGTCFLCVLLILSEEDIILQKDFLMTLKTVIDPALNGLEKILQEINTKHPHFQKKQLSVAVNQVHLIHRALEMNHADDLKKQIEVCLKLLGISVQEIKQDLKKISAFCTQLNKIFKNIFNRTNTTVTTVQMI